MLKEDCLQQCWRDIRTDAAAGVDQVSAQAYEQHLQLAYVVNQGVKRELRFQTVPADVKPPGLAIDGEKLLGILADLVRRPNLEPAEVKREQARLLDQWKRLGESADLLASVAFARKIASGTDYARGNAF